MTTPTLLKLADGLRLPLHVVTESVGILAKRRAGKSTLARRLTEQLHRTKQQIVVADPKGDWWGLLFARDGKSPGLPFVVMGGEHGHIPLEVGAGELVAKLVVTERVSIVLDLSAFRKKDVATFMTAFMETLYRLKAQEQYRTPMMLVIDEADAVAPQKPFAGEERMLGAVEDLVRRGGQRGIGVTMITQRSAVLNKNVLTQIGILIVLRTIAPQDIAAMKEWIKVHGTDEQGAELIASLPSLPIGTGWVWAPGWPDQAGIFAKHDFLLPDTFDSSATPGQQAKRVEPKHAADVDLAAFQREMAATIERAKLEDPKLARAEIARLNGQVKRLTQELERAQQQKPVGREKRVEVPVLKDAQLTRLEKVYERMLEKAHAYGESMALLWKQQEEEAKALLKVLATLTGSPNPFPTADVIPMASVGRGPVPGNARLPRPARQVPRPPTTDTGLTPAKQKILNALAFLHGVGVPQVDRTQLALFAGVPPTSGGYKNNLGALRTEGLIDYPTQGSVALTDGGAAVAVSDGIPQTTEDLHAALFGKLPPAKGRILEVLIAAYPKPIDRDVLADRCEVPPTSGGFKNNLGSLRSLGLIDYPQPGTVAAQPVLFLEGV